MSRYCTQQKKERKEMQADCVSGRLININYQDRNVDDFFFNILHNF